jgi:polyisoprenoid-binding protein YceI
MMVNVAFIRMRKLIPLTCLSALLIIRSAFAADTYVIDKNHSTMGFQVRHLFSNVLGRFDDYTGTFDVTGDLTMHGVTKEVVLKVELLGKGAGRKNSIVSGWDATTALKRSEYGLLWNQAIEGMQIAGDDVKIDLQVEADKK